MEIQAYKDFSSPLTGSYSFKRKKLEIKICCIDLLDKTYKQDGHFQVETLRVYSFQYSDSTSIVAFVIRMIKFVHKVIKT